MSVCTERETKGKNNAIVAVHLCCPNTHVTCCAEVLDLRGFQSMHPICRAQLRHVLGLPGCQQGLRFKFAQPGEQKARNLKKRCKTTPKSTKPPIGRARSVRALQYGIGSYLGVSLLGTPQNWVGFLQASLQNRPTKKGNSPQQTPPIRIEAVHACCP